MTESNNVTKGKESGSDASKTTAFSTKAKKLMVPLFLTILLIAQWGSPLHIAIIPYLIIKTSMVHPEKGETSVQYWTKFVIHELVYCGFLLVSAFLVLLPLVGRPTFTTGYYVLALYIPMLTISLHDRRYQYGPVGTFIVQTYFDIPLVIGGYICREFFGLRMLAPFANILDDSIVQGSLPFPSDIATLAAEPYNVGLIVNMCREYNGAVDKMKHFGIVQCHLPHQDTTPPTYESLVKGCAHIQQFKKHNPTKRVYIHCKGGIARASTMTLAHYVCNEDQDPSVAIITMQSKRHVVFTGVQNFAGIIRLNEERLLRQVVQD